ncbi:MAG: hypothetical protein ABI874_09470 [Chloroflexota bacterium]
MTTRPSNHYTMRLPRFFVTPESIRGERATVSGDIAHQMRLVLRLRPGERVVLLDNTCWEHEVELEAVERDVVSGRVVAKRMAHGEPRARHTLSGAAQSRQV